MSWFSRLRAPLPRGPMGAIIGAATPAGRRRLRLACEQFEDRVQPAVVTFTNPAGGPWQTAGNWDAGHAPAAGDAAVIPDLPGSQTVTFASGSASVASLTSAESLTLSGGTLGVTGVVQVSGAFRLSGGTLSGGTLAAGTTLALTAYGGKLAGGVTVAAGATVDATQNVSGSTPYADVTGGLTLNGALNLGKSDGSTYGRLYFYGSQSLSGAGAVTFGGSASNGLYSYSTGGAAATLTVGAGVSVGGGSGAVTGYSASYGDTVVLNGPVSVPTGRTLTLGGVGWTNNGTVTAAAGATVNLAGSFTTAGLGNFSAAGATVNLTGTLNNAGATLALRPSLGGDWFLRGGAVDGGTVTGAGGAKLVLTASGGKLSGGVAVAAGAGVDGSRNVNGSGSYADVTGGLTLNGSLALGRDDGTTYGRLYFNGTQTLGGSGADAHRPQDKGELVG